MSDVQATTDGLIDLLTVMLEIRHFEVKAGSLFAAGQLPGFIHLSIGQEGVAAGVSSTLRVDDYITTTHRGHGHCIAKGGGILPMMAELYGAADGYLKGRSGSMHIADPSTGILGANAIVGAGIPMAVGAAFSAAVRREDRVAVAFFGEGAVGQGVFHESMNLAALWKLPIIFVCENNQYAELSHVSVHLAAKHVVDFAGPYGISAEQVDGNDVLAVQGAAARAVARARAGEGPTLMECLTYRWRGHFEGDPQRYRSKDELAQWQGRDPILHVRGLLLARGVVESELDALEQSIVDGVEAAAEAAAALAPARTDSIMEDVYREPVTWGAKA